MADDELDPIASTQEFRKFVDEDHDSGPRGRQVLWIVGALVVIALVMLIGFLATR